MTKVQVKKSIFHFELNSKPNVYIDGIVVSMREKHYFEAILTSNDVMNIQYEIGKGFRSREIAYYTGVNDYFSPRWTNIPHATPNYGPEKH